MTKNIVIRKILGKIVARKIFKPVQTKTTKVNLPSADLWTDGSFREDTSMGSWSALVKVESTKYSLGGQIPYCDSSHHAELTGIVEGLKSLENPHKITLRTDCESIVTAMANNRKRLKGWIRNGWKNDKGKQVPAKGLWKALNELANRHEVTFEWVRSHSGIEENEECDSLAGILSNLPYSKELEDPIPLSDAETKKVFISIRNLVERLGKSNA